MRVVKPETPTLPVVSSSPQSKEKEIGHRPKPRTATRPPRCAISVAILSDENAKKVFDYIIANRNDVLLWGPTERPCVSDE